MKKEYMIPEKTLIMPQYNTSCSAYSAAHLLEHHHLFFYPEDIYNAMPRFLDSEAVKPSAVADMLNSIMSRYDGSYGYDYVATKNNDFNTLKEELSKYKEPVIIAGEYDGKSRGWDDLHYVLVAGYDKEYVYLIDSIEHSYFEYKLYNRKVKIDEFLTLWSIKNFLPARILHIGNIMIRHKEKDYTI